LKYFRRRCVYRQCIRDVVIFQESFWQRLCSWVLLLCELKYTFMFTNIYDLCKKVYMRVLYCYIIRDTHPSMNVHQNEENVKDG
jgi:hypothetical protein